MAKILLKKTSRRTSIPRSKVRKAVAVVYAQKSSKPVPNAPIALITKKEPAKSTIPSK